jgi:hypothetical protein
MSFADCVESAVKAGRLTREQAEDLYQRQQDATDRFRLDPQHSPESAARLADELGLERAKQNVRLQKYQTALQAIRNADNVNRIQGYAHGPTLGVRTLLARDSRGRATWANVEIQARAILGQAHATMAEGISQLRTRWLGLSRDKATLTRAVHEIFGEASNDPRAKAFASAWGTAAENLRLRFNRAGGAIPRREGWGMPQSHDAVKVGNVPRGEWVDFVLERLNLEKMIDAETGQPFTKASLETTLQGVYETIRTNGVSDMVPGLAGGKKLANRRQEHRFLAFRDADTWLEYQDRFGSGNIFGTMMDHLRSMSQEVALLETLGPNPAAAFRMLQDVATRSEEQPVSRAVNEAVFKIVNGSGDRNRSPFVANLFGAIRNWNVASTLGSAALSAISDIGFIGLTAGWNGTSITRTLGRYLAQLRPGNEADRILATRIGITALSWSEAYSNVGRFTELDVSGAGKMGAAAHAGATLAEVTLRASGLSAMTDAGRRAFAMEFSANLAEAFGRGLDEIEGAFGQSLRSRGMSADDWDLLRTTPLTEHKGAKFFTIDQLMDRTDIPLSRRQQLASRIQGIINEEILFAVPEPDALARVITTGGGQARGTIMGEISRSALQFKSFPIAVLSLHAQRMLAARQLRGGMTAAAYAATGIIATTTLGMLAMNLKLIARGKDPRDLEDPKSWAAAFVQGGGAGIYGDFLFHDANRFGSGPVTTQLGPTVGMLEDTAKLGWGNVQQLIQGKDPKIAADMVAFGSRYMPGGSLWYTRLLLEREIFDQLALEADPRGARERFNRTERRAREQGTGHWWRPGQRSPDRMPDLGADE